MKTAIYIRVSTQEQVQEGYSISAQKERLHAFIQSQDWDISNYYIDEGKSAKDLNRPELQRLMDDVEQGNIDVVLVYRLDRLTRSVTDLYKLLDHFDKYNTAFRSATEVYDTTTAMGRLFITLVAALAQWERENLAERVKVGMQQMVQEGRWHGGITPYGYEWNGETLEIVEEEANVIKKIFDLYLSGKGDNAIATYLNDRGYKTRKGTWSGNAVGRILTNPAYIGNIRYMDEIIEGFSSPIIDEVSYYRVQEIRKGRSSLHPRQVGSTYIFSGIIRCARCGAALGGKPSPKNKKENYKLYMCGNKQRGVCDLPLLNEEIIEEAFLKEVENLSNKFALKEAAKDQKRTPSIDSEINEVKQALESIKKRRRKWQLAFANEALTLEELKELTEEDRKKESDLKQQLEEMEKRNSENGKTPEEISRMLSSFIVAWDALSVEEKKTGIQILLDKLFVDTDSFRPNQYRKRKVYIKDIEFKQG